MPTIRSFVSAAICVAVATSPYAWAAPGDLDPGFGSGGIVTTELNSIEDAHALALQPDGKLVAAGRKLIGSAYPEIPSYTDIAVVRYDVDGSLDGSFGTGGVVTWPQSYDQDARTVLIQADDKIVVGGASVLLRYDPDGTLDGTFGSGGVVTTNTVSAVVQQSDGKLVAASPVRNGSDYDFRVTRYNDDGTVDGTFGSGGSVITPIGSGHDWPNALVLQPDGKLVAGGFADIPTRQFALVRYETDGSLDASFGTGGIVVGPNGPGYYYDALAALVVQPDGKLVAAGSIANQFTLVRYNDDGSVDTTFANGGVAVAASESGGEARALVMQPNGKLLAVGSLAIFPPSHQIAVVAYNPDGTQDPTFGNWGVVVTAPAGGADAYAAVLQPDIELVVAGVAYPGNDDFLLARYAGAAGPIVIPSPTASPTPTVTATPTASATATPTPLCAPAPAGGCREPFAPEKSQLSLKHKPDNRDTLLWKWSYGPVTTHLDFADPSYLTSYSLCVYDRIAGVPTLVLAANIPSNVQSGPCGSNPCWRQMGTGFKYHGTKAATPDGISSAVLKDGFTALKAKIKVKGKGLHLPMPALPLAQASTVTVQLVNSSGLCWAADYTAPALGNSTAEFRDRSD